MSKLVGIISDAASGGTFLSWTVEYLTGKGQYFGYNNDVGGYPKLLDLVDDPRGSSNNRPHIINAHKFVSNEYGFRSASAHKHPCKEFIDLLKEHDSHIYCHYNPDMIRELQNTPHAVNIRLINEPMYFQNYIRRDHNTEVYSNAELLQMDMAELYDKSYEKWNPKTFWDIREFLALNRRPHEFKVGYGPYEKFDSNKPHFPLHANDLYNHFDISVRDLFDYIGYDIDEDCYDHWINVWHRWRKVHTDRLLFSQYLDIIIEYVLNGYDMDLSRFELDVVQQACIMHELIYKHGLTITGWGVESFSSTHQLHSLLEKSTLPVENIYGVLNEQS